MVFAGTWQKQSQILLDEHTFNPDIKQNPTDNIPRNVNPWSKIIKHTKKHEWGLMETMKWWKRKAKNTNMETLDT